MASHFPYSKKATEIFTFFALVSKMGQIKKITRTKVVLFLISCYICQYFATLCYNLLHFATLCYTCYTYFAIHILLYISCYIFAQYVLTILLSIAINKLPCFRHLKQENNQRKLLVFFLDL